MNLKISKIFKFLIPIRRYILREKGTIPRLCVSNFHVQHHFGVLHVSSGNRCESNSIITEHWFFSDIGLILLVSSVI